MGTLEFLSTVRGYHIYMKMWTPASGKSLIGAKESGTSESSDSRGSGILEHPTGLFGGFRRGHIIYKSVVHDIQEQIDASPHLKSP